ncbi:hypothetical protein IU485_28100 [Nocardia cyriacigeorgica]|uniref:LtfC-like domain-containing protein n=1 Tax=Nocardia cyriacigeorgica TaxID=135487 RepID=UPI0018955AA9|nr:hypothetical protein [Nocardia cyriacigeorgica]MBF6085236.1 hypothetical protein [Nocardia cyriacigeorgica]
MTIGREPKRDTLILTLGADFVHTIKLTAHRSFPAGTTIGLHFYPPGDPNAIVPMYSFSALVYPERAEWWIESSVVDAIPDRAHFRIYVSYPETPTLEHAWFIGEVTRLQ